MSNLQQIVVLTPVILLALTVHEYSHGFIAYKLGDPTAKNLGRLTLNPLPHLDLFGTLFLFLFHFGWAKPVPVNPFYFKNPRKDLLKVALAGPLSNVLLALFSGLAIRGFSTASLTAQSGVITDFFLLFFIFSLQINLALAFFNLLPVPPLDGSRILGGIIPKKYYSIYYQIERYGFIVIFFLIFLDYLKIFPVFSILLWKPVSFFSYIFSGYTF